MAYAIIISMGVGRRLELAAIPAGELMYKYRFDNTLRSPCSRSSRRSAFSLAELVVSVGILVLMMSLAGQVFTLTVKSTGQALALTETMQMLRALEQTLREDLRHVHPGRSVIVIQGNPVNAYWSAEGLEAGGGDDPSKGYDHVADPTREDEEGNLVSPRADMLMIFTARSGSTYAQASQYGGLASNVQQVVYGHAELGEYVPAPSSAGVDFEFQPDLERDPGQATFPIDRATDYPSVKDVTLIPANTWHLARRGILLVPTNTPAVTSRWEAKKITNFEDLLFGKTDVIGNVAYTSTVLTPGAQNPWYLPELLDSKIMMQRSRLDVTPPPLYGRRLGHYFIPGCASFKVEWSLDPHSEFVAGRLDTINEVLWIDPGRYDEDDESQHPLTELVRAAEEGMNQDPQDPSLCDLLGMESMHPDGDSYSLVHRFMGSELPKNDCDDYLGAYNPDGAWQPLSEFVATGLAGQGRPNLVAFGAARRNPGLDGVPGNQDDEIVPEDIFPHALRITVDVVDRERRLERPIRHVMVIPVGG